MAAQGDIDRVKALLDGVDEPWDDAKIGTVLDTVGSVSKAMQAFWSAKANATYALTDVQESGSGRSLSVIYRNAMEQLARWDAVIAKEEEAVIDPSGLRTHRITRKMPR